MEGGFALMKVGKADPPNAFVIEIKFGWVANFLNGNLFSNALAFPEDMSANFKNP